MKEKMIRSYAEYIVDRVREIDDVGAEISRLHKHSTEASEVEELTNGLKEVFGDLGAVTFRLINSVRADYPDLDPDAKLHSDLKARKTPPVGMKMKCSFCCRSEPDVKIVGADTSIFVCQECLHSLAEKKSE